MSDGTDGSIGLPDPSTIDLANNPTDGSMGPPDPAGDIVSGSFGNNGGSSGDNGANGGGDAGYDPGTGSQGENPGPPTQDDIDLYKQQLKESNPTWTDAQLAQHVSTLLNNISSANPNWAGAIGKLAGGVVNGATGGLTPGGTSNGGGSPLGTTDLMGLAAAGGLAYQQFNNADQYTKQAEKYATQLNPYGAYRDAAAQKLAALQADPSSIANTPGYQFALSQGLGAVANRDNRSFGVGAGSTNPDMMNYAQGLASKTYNDTINQYSQQAGVGITPAAAAGILQTGMQGNIASQNNAINALMSPFGPGNNTGGSPGNNLINSAGNAIKNWFGGNANNQLFPNGDPGNIVNNQQTPSVPYDPNAATAADLGTTVPNNNTGVAPGGT